MTQIQVLHRFWAGPRKMPEKYQVYGDQWRNLNPDWTVIDWEESVQEEFPELQSIFDSLYKRDAGRRGIELYVQLADVIGYALVQRNGGVYLNVDIQPIRALPDDLPSTAWASYENNTDWSVINAAIGAPEPEDPFWTGLLAHLPERYFANPTDEMVATTGPGYLTDYARIHASELFVFPVETFNYVHWKQIAPGGDASDVVRWKDESEIPEGVIALHHWGHKKLNAAGQVRTNWVETATQG